ncbi:MAG TPA: DNA alkylation repair protein [bacterium]|nr:DNA alkylation repair protein [bacterium]
MSAIIKRIRQTLEQEADEKTRTTGTTFFKEPVQLHVIKAAQVSKIAKSFFQEIKGQSKAQVFALCDELWQSGFLEESFIACDWSYALRNRFESADLDIFERWLHEYVDNWASCDTLCNHTIGSFVVMYPSCLSRLKTWSQSPDRWLRRAAAVSLIIPAREGKFLEDIFEIADSLLLDTEDLVQKGYGWMLKAASQAHQQKVFDYVFAHKAAMPRTALRYAIEKMPKELKAQAMAK